MNHVIAGHNVNRDDLDRIVICDPYRNRLLSEGPKTDKIDANKLYLPVSAGLL